MNLKKRSRSKFKIFSSFTGKSRNLGSEDSNPILLCIKERPEEESFQTNLLKCHRYQSTIKIVNYVIHMYISEATQQSQTK